MNNQLREIKKSRLVEEDAFTYMICSDDRKNITLPGAGQPAPYNIDFGGFSEQYDNYKCEVQSLCLTTGLIQSNNNYYFICDGLADDSYFCRSKLSRRETIISVVNTTTFSDLYRFNENNIVSFRVNNCRVPKKVTFSFLKSDFTAVNVGTDFSTDLRWVLTLKMTPIVDY